MATGTKLCPWCRRTKPLGEFAVDRKKRDGRFYICKSCKRADDRRRRSDPVLGEAMRECGRRWHRENPERSRAISRRRNLKQRFGITEEEYDRLLAEQDGVCAICGEPPTPNGIAELLCVDHDHATGLIRGLLCHPCNRALGQFRDDVDLLRAAIGYLLRPPRTG